MGKKIVEKQVEDGIEIFISDGTEEKFALHVPDDIHDDLKAMVKNDEKVKAFLHKMAMNQVK